MKRCVLWAVLACALTPRSRADEVPAPPPLPPASVPAIEERAPAPGRSGRVRKAPAAPLIRLGEKQETDNPFGRGAGYVEEGTFTVKADDGRLSAVLNAAAYSHSFYGVPSLSVASVQLVQEFEVVAGDPNRGTVELTLAAKMLGTIRTERNEKATGAIRVADAAIAVPGGSPFVWVAFPPYERSGVASERYEREVVAPPVRLPAGRYVLIANLVLATEVDACLRGHAEVIFAPPSERGSWKSEDNPPPKPKSKEGFRFGLVIGASVSPG